MRGYTWGINPEDEADTALMFFDYEMAFGVGGWGSCAPAPFPAELKAILDWSELEAAVEDISTFDTDLLANIVVRIPESHLRSEDKSDIIEHLMARRVQLADLLLQKKEKGN